MQPSEESNAQYNEKADVEQQHSQEEVKNVVPETTSEKKDTPEDINWKAFREARKKDRIEREAAEKRASEKEAEAAALRAAMEAAFTKSPVGFGQGQIQNYESNQETYEDEDAKIEKKVNQIIAAREAEEERRREEREQTEYPKRLMHSYRDFNSVVTEENLDYLEYHYPEIARPLKRLGDGYDKWADTYLAIKKFVPNATNAKKEALRADQNLSKPKSSSSISVGPNQAAARESVTSAEARRMHRWNEMKKIMSSVG